MSVPSAHRTFYKLPEGLPNEETNGDMKHGGHEPPDDPLCPAVEERGPQDGCAEDGLFGYIRRSVIGKDRVFSGPYGLRKVQYCDYTASGRSLSFIEDYIRDEVLPDYGNTHTTTTVTSLQTTLFRHEARDIIRNSVHASEHDAVIFVGSGCTAAVHKLIHSLHLQEPPVVFVGPYEHHSNLLPWREIGAAVIPISETADGSVNLQHLKEELEQWKKEGHQMIGCFAAASNVSGVLVDVDAINILLHKYGALAFWDYATAGAYVRIDMNPITANSEDQHYAYKDAVFLSPHKFIGGVQTPGVLIAKKALFKNPVPEGCGGGSVFFVRRTGQRYLQETEVKEEGGTPAIVESVRAGLVFQLKEAATTEAIMGREHKFTRMAFDAWSPVSNLVLLGPTQIPRLAIFSFLVKHPSTGLFLHHNYTCTLLNDLFGIQARGGCACAGPYAEDLLGIDEDMAIRVEDMLVEDSRLDRIQLRRYREYSEREILRPGFVRLNLPYFASDEMVSFVIEAVKLVAEHGWKLLPQYIFNPETGEWRHRNHQLFKDRKWLGFISYKTGKMQYREPSCPEKGPLPGSYIDCLLEAEQIFINAHKVRVHIADQTVMFTGEAESLRWFMLPSEAMTWLQQPKLAAAKKTKKVPFHPAKYPRPVENDKLLSKPLSYANCFRKVFNESLPKENSEEKSSKNKDTRSRKSDLKVGHPLRNTQKKKYLSRGRSEERAISSTASLADGLFSALKNIQKDIGAGDFMEGLENTLSQGYTHVDDKETHDDQDGSDQILNRSTDIDSLDTAGPSDIGPSEIGVQKTIDNMNSQKGNSTIVCEDGACLKKRETNASDSVNLASGKHKWHPPPKKVFTQAVEALEEFDMIQNGDRVMVCLSGGKDSLSLLHILRQYQFYAKKKGISFEFGAVTIDPMTSAYDPSPLKSYLAMLGVPYAYEEQAIIEAAANLPYEVASICSFCSRMKRGRIYHAARRDGYNVLAMGHHLDDLAESFLMSVFHNGVLRTMKASYTVKEKDLRVIRPFVYVREKDLRQFAEEKKLPVIPENCPGCFEAPKERHRMKQLLASQEVVFPRLFHSIQTAIKPILAINKTGINLNTLFQQVNNLEDDQNDTDDCALADP